MIDLGKPPTYDQKRAALIAAYGCRWIDAGFYLQAERRYVELAEVLEINRSYGYADSELGDLPSRVDRAFQDLLAAQANLTERG